MLSLRHKTKYLINLIFLILSLSVLPILWIITCGSECKQLQYKPIHGWNTVLYCGGKLL